MRGVKINRARLLEDLHKLRSFGAAEPFIPTARGGDGVKKGVVRPALSEPDIEAREWLMERAASAGLMPSMDKLGNTIAKSDPPQGQKRMLLGSHSDTQPEGGWLDGALGVVFALEAARAVQDAGGPNAIDVINFQDEEGRFGGLVGSHAFIGEDINFDAISASPDSVASVAPRVTLREAIAARGLTDRPLLHLSDLEDEYRATDQGYLGFFEAHIEQGRRLERASQSVAVVSSIVGLRQFDVTFTGEQNHAGSTAMADRKDAAFAAFRFCTAVSDRLERAARAAGSEVAVWTVGTFEMSPNAHSIVPGEVKLTLQFRDEAEGAAFGAAEAVGIAMARSRMRVAAMPMCSGLRTHIEGAAQAHAPGAWQTLHSGAVHDAGIVARRLPASMLFVPSIGGISHDFREDTCEDDIAAGAQVYATAAVRMLEVEV